MRIGIDIGSTTVKVVLLDDQDQIVFKTYERHMSKVREKTAETLRGLAPQLKGTQVQVAITGSAGLGVAKAAGLEFVQEVFATAGAVEKFLPDTDAVVELGGEDAKIIFLTGGLEERMNGSCAGGTGAFIDQMATLLGITPSELDQLSLGSEKRPQEAAARLFAALRELDERGDTVALCEAVDTAGIGLAVMNRMGRAAAFDIEQV